MAATWVIAPHTRAKHILLDAYHDRWFSILAQRNPPLQKITYVDGFAGPGVYEGGEPGSPIIALESILGNKVLERYSGQVEFHFVERDEARFASLEEQLKPYRAGTRAGSQPVQVDAV